MAEPSRSLAPLAPVEAARKPLVSVIAPVYNEDGVIEEFLSRLVAAVSQVKERYDFEFILVDDGSRDSSLAVMKRFSRFEKRLRVIELRRNYGQTPALQAGLDAARGSIFITMDADLQHFPEEIPQFLARLEEGHDVVCGWRRERQEGIVRRWPSRVANYCIRQISNLSIHDFGTTYRAYRAELARDLRLYGDFHRYIPVLGHLMGAKTTELPIQNIERPKGRSNYGIGRTFGVFLDLMLLYFMTRYLDRPMRAFGKLAAISFGAGASILTVLVVYAYATNFATVRERSGWFLLSMMLILAALQFLVAGILAEILIRVHFGQGDSRVYRKRTEWTSENVGG